MQVVLQEAANLESQAIEYTVFDWWCCCVRLSAQQHPHIPPPAGAAPPVTCSAAFPCCLHVAQCSNSNSTLALEHFCTILVCSHLSSFHCNPFVVLLIAFLSPFSPMHVIWLCTLILTGSHWRGISCHSQVLIEDACHVQWVFQDSQLLSDMEEPWLPLTTHTKHPIFHFYTLFSPTLAALGETAGATAHKIFPPSLGIVGRGEPGPPCHSKSDYIWFLPYGINLNVLKF